jgi:hypothetical protein
MYYVDIVFFYWAADLDMGLAAISSTNAAAGATLCEYHLWSLTSKWARSLFMGSSVLFLGNVAM